MVTLQEILNGLESVFGPIIGGVGQFFGFIFNTPTIAGASIGAWALFFTALSIIISGAFGHD